MLRPIQSFLEPPQDPWKMDEYQKITEEIIAQIGEGITAEQEVQLVTNIRSAIPGFSSSLLNALKCNAKRMLKEHRNYRVGFTRRNYKRWKDGFDRLYMLIVMCEETGEAINNALRSTLQNGENAKFEAVCHLHARSILVSREILCLMKGGFPDGALGRWRTLHEIAVIAQFLNKTDVEISERYLLDRTIQAYKAAHQYIKYQEAANLQPFGEEELQKIIQAKESVVKKYGPEMKEDWGWAYPVIGKQPNFAKIEKFVELDHWRPRYKWATQDTHPNHRPRSNLLALSESQNDCFLTAESNSGMTDPAQMMAHSLLLATEAFASLEPNIDRTIAVQTMQLLVNEIGDTFMKVAHESLEAHRRKLNRKSRFFALSLWNTTEPRVDD